MLCQQNLQVILRSCWPAETDRLWWWAGCWEEGSLSCEVSRPPDTPSHPTHGRLALPSHWLPCSGALPHSGGWAASLAPWPQEPFARSHRLIGRMHLVSQEMLLF